MDQDKELPVVERRLAKCPHGGDCEVAERQAILMRELHDFKTEFTELKDSIKEIVATFNDAKTVVHFFGGAGTFIRWLAITLAACGTVWAAITHWPKH